MAVSCLPDLPALRAEEGGVLPVMDAKKKRRQLSEELEELARTEYVDGYFMAFLYDSLGGQKKRFEELERAAAERLAAFCS